MFETTRGVAVSQHEEDGRVRETKDDVAGYLFDNGSTNKTKLNGKVIEAKKYYRLKGSDCVQFGSSTREYVIMDESLVEKKR